MAGRGAGQNIVAGVAQVAGEGRPCWRLLTLIALTRVSMRFGPAFARVFFKHARGAAALKSEGRWLKPETNTTTDLLRPAAPERERGGHPESPPP